MVSYKLALHKADLLILEKHRSGFLYERDYITILNFDKVMLGEPISHQN